MQLEVALPPDKMYDVSGRFPIMPQSARKSTNFTYVRGNCWPKPPARSGRPRPSMYQLTTNKPIDLCLKMAEPCRIMIPFLISSNGLELSGECQNDKH